MSQINLISPTTFTTAMLIADEVQAANGSADSVPKITQVGSEAASVALEIQSTLGGLLLPRMTTAQRLLLTPLNGMMVYDTTVNTIYAYENGSWGSAGILSLSQGSNIVLTPNPITTSGTVALNPVLTGITSITTAKITLTGGFTDHVNVLSSSLTSYQVLGSDSVVIPNTTTNAITLFVPSAPVQGETIKVIDGFGNAGTNNISATGINGTLPTVAGSAITVGTNPFEMVVTPNGNYGYVANNGTNTVSVIQNASLNTASVLKTLTVGNTPYDVCVTPNGSYVYVTNSADSSVSIISGASSGSSAVATTFTVGSGTGTPEFCVCSPNGNVVMVLDPAGHQAFFIGDASTGGTTTATVPLAAGALPVWGVFTPNSNYAYIAGQNGTIYVIQNASNLSFPLPSLLTTFTCGGSPTFECIAITPDGNRVYVCNYLPGELYVITGASSGSPTHLTTVSTGLQTFSIALTPDGNYAYVPAFNNTPANVIVFNNISSGTPAVMTVLTLASGSNPEFIRITPSGNYAYISNSGSSGTNSVTVLHNVMSTNPSVLTNLTTDGIPFDINIVPNGSVAYVIENTSGELFQLRNTEVVSTLISTNYGGKTIVYNGTGWNAY